MAVAKIKKKPVGCPPRFKPTKETWALIETWASQKFTKEQISLKLGFASRYIWELMTKFPEISEAIERGRMKALAKVVERFDDIMLNSDKDGVSLEACKFFLERQAGWVTPKDNLNLNVDQSKKLEMHFHFNDGVKKEVVEIEKENTTKIIDT